MAIHAERGAQLGVLRLQRQAEVATACGGDVLITNQLLGGQDYVVRSEAEVLALCLSILSLERLAA